MLGVNLELRFFCLKTWRRTRQRSQFARGADLVDSEAFSFS